MKIKLFAFIVFTLLWILDTVFSNIFITTYGIETEANILIKNIISHFGMFGFYFLKFVTWFGLVFVNILYFKKYKRLLTYWIEILLSSLVVVPVYLGFQIVKNI